MSINLSNTNTTLDRYNLEPLLTCDQFYFMGAYCVFLIVMGIVCNSILINSFIKDKALLKPINFMFLSFCVLSLIATILEVPMVAVSCFQCKFTYGKIGCEIEAFIMFFCGCSSVYLLMAISIERLLVIYKPLLAQQINVKKSALSVGLCCFLGLLWAAFPFMGWSYYSLEGVNISCATEWRDQSWNVVSYNIAIFVFVFFIPFCILLFTTFKFIFMVIKLSFYKLNFSIFSFKKLKEFRNKIADRISVQTVQVRMQKEQKMTIHLVISICKLILKS